MNVDMRSRTAMFPATLANAADGTGSLQPSRTAMWIAPDDEDDDIYVRSRTAMLPLGDDPAGTTDEDEADLVDLGTRSRTAMLPEPETEGRPKPSRTAMMEEPDSSTDSSRFRRLLNALRP
ncbi:unnamed protein product [Effrenium voratum]|nr:unnamed protein product [Effrenium voratum]